MKKLQILLFVFCLISTVIHAQKRNDNRFNAGIIAGVNTSQIDGDWYAGYDKFGGFAGFRAIARINKTSDLVF